MKTISLAAAIAILISGCTASVDSDSAHGDGDDEEAVGATEEPIDDAFELEAAPCYTCSHTCASGLVTVGKGITVDDAWQSMSCGGYAWGDGPITCVHWSCIYN